MNYSDISDDIYYNDDFSYLENIDSNEKDKSNLNVQVLCDVDNLYNEAMKKDSENYNKLYNENNRKIEEDINEMFSYNKNYYNQLMEQYKRDVLGISNELSPLHNWLSKQYEGGHHHKHNHPSVLFNLVYYIYGSENAPLRLELGNAKSRLQEGYNFSFNRAKMTPFNSQGFVHFPKDGEIVCIPGWLKHGTDTSMGDRMCIGYNFFVKGVLGECPFEVINLSTSLDNDK